MSLKNYRAKRTPSSLEPLGTKTKSSSNKLIFVVQRHEARHLHFDFRIELKGVLKSWAIPKGPSMDPSEKRLAIEVEDHPLEYGKFHGTIPAGHYGAGTVEIWDKGTVNIENCPTKREAEAELEKQYLQGEMHLSLSGKKLKGDFVLVRLKRSQKQNQWLLIKHKEHKEEIHNPDGLEKAPKGKMPTHIKPMLATLYAKAFDNPDWIFEIKWDGYRAIAEISSASTKLYSRNFISFADRFPALIEDLQKLNSNNVILDGEIVALDQKGVSRFQLLQNYLRHRAEAKVNLRYYAFDLLYLKDRDLRELPLIERKKMLKELLEKSSLKLIEYSDHVEEKGIDFFKEAEKYKLEGIMAKKADSTYVPKRSRQWLKIKAHGRQEVVIGGFTEPRGSRKYFGSLLMGVYDKKELKYVGHVGGGFDSKLLEELYAKMKPLITEKSPFTKEPRPNTPVKWLRPKLVAEVSFLEWTNEGIMRQPIFMGLREDKKSQEVVRENPKPVSVTTKKHSSKANPVPKYSEKTIVDEDLISNPDKIFWPDEKYTKRDLLEYYASISNYILPHLKDRPLVMHRYPDGINGEDFYQKEAPEHSPEWLQTADVRHSNKNVHYVLAPDKRSLLYIVNLGSIEIHSFLSRLQNLDYPDYAVMDLDPRGNPFSELIDIAQYLHGILNKLKLHSYCKTSGKKGLHVYIPTGGQYNFEFTLAFTQLLAQIIRKAFPKQTTLKRDPDMRQKKVYLDCLQNARTKTMIAPYSVRPEPGATVSTPLKWSEIKRGLEPQDFTIKTVIKRLDRMGDLFKPVLSVKSVDMQACLKKLEKMFPGQV